MARAGLPRPVAAIDVGSNSIRVAIVALDGEAYLEILEEASATPRLIHEVQRDGRLSGESVEEVVSILRDFQAIARGADADPVVAVATSAVRDAANSAALVNRLQKDLGLTLQIVDGIEEARLAFLGAVHSLPVERGLVVDIGGGSVEVLRFNDRRPGASWTLPLGAVRLTAEYLSSDPPSQAELRILRDHIAKTITAAGIDALPADGVLVGTGGTARNIAKMDRARHRYPIARLHGYELTRDGVRSVADLVRTRTLVERRNITGLNEDRADIIVAGALVLQALVDATSAERLVISGQGLREGIAFDSRGGDLPKIATLRQAALDRAVSRFAPAYAGDAIARLAVVDALVSAAEFVEGPEVTDALRAASMLLDLGRGVDYYNRHRHTEALAVAYGLPGWTHRELALTCAIVRQADSEKYDAIAAYRPLLTAADQTAIAKAGAILAAADEMQRRTSPDAPSTVSRLRDGGVRFDIEMDGRPLTAISERLERVLGLRLTAS